MACPLLREQSYCIYDSPSERQAFRRITKWHFAAAVTFYAATFACMAATFCSSVEHNEIITHHFCRDFPVAILIIPVAGAKAAFYIYQAAFVQVFLGQFGQPSPENNCMPFCLRH